MVLSMLSIFLLQYQKHFLFCGCIGRQAALNGDHKLCRKTVYTGCINNNQVLLDWICLNSTTDIFILPYQKGILLVRWCGSSEQNSMKIPLGWPPIQTDLTPETLDRMTLVWLAPGASEKGVVETPGPLVCEILTPLLTGVWPGLSILSRLPPQISISPTHETSATDDFLLHPKKVVVHCSVVVTVAKLQRCKFILHFELLIVTLFCWVNGL